MGVSEKPPHLSQFCLVFDELFQQVVTERGVLRARQTVDQQLRIDDVGQAQHVALQAFPALDCLLYQKQSTLQLLTLSLGPDKLFIESDNSLVDGMEDVALGADSQVSHALAFGRELPLLLVQETLLPFFLPFQILEDRTGR